MPKGNCDACHERPALYHERVDYVSFNGKERLRQKNLRRVCSDCAHRIVNHLPRDGSMVAVVDALRRWFIEPERDNWVRVVEAAEPFVNMGDQTPLFDPDA